MTYFIKILLAAPLLAQCTYGDYAADETSLIATLHKNSSVHARPARTTVVTAYVVLFALNRVDIGSEVMSLTGLLYSVWTDQRLTWDPLYNNHIYQVVLNAKDVWTPPLVIENEVNKIGLLGGDDTPLRVFYTGDVFWNPPISTTTGCSADITYYPYDKQTCTITLIGWSYTVDEVDVVTDPKIPIDRTYMSDNGEWDLLETGYEMKNLTDDINTFRKVLFKLTFRRKWPYYGQNIILPIVLNSLLMAMVFVVPIESGEKMGYCLTVLLSYIVLLTMVSSNLPSISSQTSVIQMYLSIVLCIGTASILCTIAVLQIYHQDKKKPIPRWLQILTKYILGPLICRSYKPARVTSPTRGDNNDINRCRPESFQDGYSCREIAVILDKFFFGLFAAILLILTAGVIIALFIAYHS